MTLKQIFRFALFSLVLSTKLLVLYASDVLPVSVNRALAKAGANKRELLNVIHYYSKQKDHQKLAAALFLIANMDVHNSANFYWADKNGKKISFDELAYPDFDKALTAFEVIKKNTPGIHPIPVIQNDLQSVKADFLISNIDQAFKEWKNSTYKSLSFDLFCEFILPYRVTEEPLQNWRSIYQPKFKWVNEKLYTIGILNTLNYVAADYKTWFVNTYSHEERKEPLPRLGALQLLSRKKGPCEDIADLEVFTLRSQGIPSTVSFIPHWATTAGSHFMNMAFDPKGKSIPFDAGRTPSLNNPLEREPGKVFALTFSKQANSLAAIQPANKIPPGFMRAQTYVDVTEKYWECTSFKSSVNLNVPNNTIAYAAVFNGMQWKPIWWSKIKNSEAHFTNMGKGAVYLPMIYQNNKLSAAGYPVAVGYHRQLLLKPDNQHLRSVTIEQQDKHLIFKSGKKYRLYYWDDRWRLIGLRIAGFGSTRLAFDQVPLSCLLILIPEYTEGKERPFVIMDDGKRQWW